MDLYFFKQNSQNKGNDHVFHNNTRITDFDQKTDIFPIW